MAVLRILLGPDPGELIPLESDTNVLGRHPQCDIVLESAPVSRQHARISMRDGNYFLEDLNSRNGTYLNGKLVTKMQPLQEGDEIGICDLLFAFHAEKPEPNVSSTQLPRRSVEQQTTFVDDDKLANGSVIMTKVDLSSGSTGLSLQVNTEAKLKALLEISQHLSRALELNDVLPKLLESLFHIFPQADRGFIVLKDPQTGRLIPKALKCRNSEDNEVLRISRTIVRSVIETKQAILSADAASDTRFNMAESIVDFQIRSMMCAPLVAGEGDALGVIQLDTSDQRKWFNREDLDVLAGVACQAAFAIENAQLHDMAVREEAMRRELAVAHEVQRGFLPSESPLLPRYDFFEFYEPASDLGGDYYDYVDLPRGRLAVVLGDVSGKGISASLLMAKLSAEARFCLISEVSPAAAIGRLNRIFCGSGWEDRFVTLVLAVIDPAENNVTLVNAGHMPPILRHGKNVVEPVGEEITNLPLGVDRDTRYEQCVLPLAAGESLTLYTDGITEAMNTESDLYGHDRLMKQLATEALSINALGRHLLDDVKKFVGSRSQSDDMCLACFGRNE
jgi:serine phosphatase RsbU (regulator of sigma subunit)/pSer/pThr/pTyr-binding forkhead associated (FHA) protein